MERTIDSMSSIFKSLYLFGATLPIRTAAYGCVPMVIMIDDGHSINTYNVQSFVEKKIKNN